MGSRRRVRWSRVLLALGVLGIGSWTVRSAHAPPKGPLAAAVAEAPEARPIVRKRGGNSRPDYERSKPLEPRPSARSPFDVGVASFTNARRMIEAGKLPPPAWVRVEEFANYPDYDDSVATGDALIGVTLEAAPHPWREGHHLLRIGLRAGEAEGPRPPVHLVVLVDVSASMANPRRLDLAKESLVSLVDALGPEDTVGIVTYAGRVAEALPLTPTTRKAEIFDAIASLSAEGSYASGSAVDLAWGMLADAEADGVGSRILVISDGDPNVGDSPHAQTLVDVAEHSKEGILLSAVGFGERLDPSPGMEELADHGRGDYAFVDDAAEAQRIFADDLPASMPIAARDVRVQVDLHSSAVISHRLVGFEDAPTWREDLGDVGSGWAATALYDVVLRDSPTGDLATVHIRATAPGAAVEQAWTVAMPVERAWLEVQDATKDFRVAAAMATFGEILRGSGPGVPLEDVAAAVRASRREGSRDEALAALIERAATLKDRRYQALEEDGITVSGARYLGASESAVDTYVGWHARALRECAVGDVAGDLRIKFFIWKDGTVSDAIPKAGTIGDPAVEECVRKRFLEMRFPAPPGGGIAIVTYPMTFFPWVPSAHRAR